MGSYRDRENRGYRTIYKSSVIDDGWHLPQEVIETIELKVQMAWKDAYRQVCYENSRHRGAWIDADIARQYAAKSWIWRVISDGQYVGKVREIGEELQREYGVTEIEAINIMNERNVADYLNKYYRIQHKIPLNVNEQAICDDIAYEYLAFAM